MSEDLTLQTQSAFERIKDSLLGKTEDSFEQVVIEINNLTLMYNEIQQVAFEVNNMDDLSTVHYVTQINPEDPYNECVESPHQEMTKNYKITVETFDGLHTIWYEKSKAKKATDLICRRVYDQLCGLNIKRISVDLSV